MNLRSKEIVFWTCYIGAILLFIFRFDQYERPITYFICMALATAILAIQIFETKHEKKQIAYILCKVGLLIITTQWTQLLIYPDSLIGTDSWYHQFLIDRIMNGSEIGRNTFDSFRYYGTLFFHYWIGYFQVFTGLSVKWSMMVSVGIPYIAVVTLVAYKMGSMVWTYKTGLMSALSLSVASMFLYFGIEIIPSTLGIVMVMLVLWLSIESIRNFGRKYNEFRYVMIAILLVALVYTNALITLICIVLMCMLWLFLVVSKAIYKDNKLVLYPLVIIAMLYSIVILLIWVFDTGQIRIALRIIGIDELTQFFAPYVSYGEVILRDGVVDSVNGDTGGKVISSYLSGESPDASYWVKSFTALTASHWDEVMGMVAEYQRNIPIVEVIIKRATFVIYGLLGMFGVYSLIRRWKILRNFGFTIMILAVVITSVCLVSILLSRYLFISRQILIMQIMLAPMVGFGICKLIDMPKISILWNRAIVGIVVFVLALSTFMGSYANIDNRTFLPTSQARLSLIQEELAGINDICNKWEGDVYTDWYAGYYLYHVKSINKQWNLKDIYDASEPMAMADYSTLSKSAIMIVRNEVNEYPIMVGERYYRLNNNADEVLVKQGFKNIYDNGVVRGYAR